VDWVNLTQNGEKWRTAQNTVLEQSGSIKCGEFIDWQTKFEFLNTDSAVWN